MARRPFGPSRQSLDVTCTHAARKQWRASGFRSDSLQATIGSCFVCVRALSASVEGFLYMELKGWLEADFARRPHVRAYLPLSDGVHVGRLHDVAKEVRPIRLRRVNDSAHKGI